MPSAATFADLANTEYFSETSTGSVTIIIYFLVHEDKVTEFSTLYRETRLITRNKIERFLDLQRDILRTYPSIPGILSYTVVRSKASGQFNCKFAVRGDYANKDAYLAHASSPETRRMEQANADENLFQDQAIWFGEELAV